MPDWMKKCKSKQADLRMCPCHSRKDNEALLFHAILKPSIFRISLVTFSILHIKAFNFVISLWGRGNNSLSYCSNCLQGFWLFLGLTSLYATWKQEITKKIRNRSGETGIRTSLNWNRCQLVDDLDSPSYNLVLLSLVCNLVVGLQIIIM